MKITLEIAVDSPQYARAAMAAGADRLELCDRLDVGGTTPPVAWVREASREGWANVVMIRPRIAAAGAFVADAGMVEVMERQIDETGAAGVGGFVFGLLAGAAGSLRIDAEACARLVKRAAGRPCVFHRAFDELGDSHTALEEVIALGFRRVLTAGGRGGAAENAARLGELRRLAAGRIEILPGGGVRNANAAAIIAASGCDQVHSSGKNAAGVFDAGEVRAIGIACASSR